MKNKKRSIKFLECLGNGMSFYEIEAENNSIDEILRGDEDEV